MKQRPITTYELAIVKAAVASFKRVAKRERLTPDEYASSLQSILGSRGAVFKAVAAHLDLGHSRLHFDLAHKPKPKKFQCVECHKIKSVDELNLDVEYDATRPPKFCNSCWDDHNQDLRS